MSWLQSLQSQLAKAEGMICFRSFMYLCDIVKTVMSVS